MKITLLLPSNVGQAVGHLVQGGHNNVLHKKYVMHGQCMTNHYIKLDGPEQYAKITKYFQEYTNVKR